MKILLLFIIFIFIISNNVFAYNNSLALKAGGNFSIAHIKVYQGTTDTYGSGGFNTKFGYRYTNMEFNIASFLYYGRLDNIQLETKSTKVKGSGKVRSVHFSFMSKYIFDKTYRKIWHPYISIGPTITQHTVKLNEYENIMGIFTNDNRMSTRSYGGTFMVGFEEILESKKLHPVFVEFTYSFLISKSVTLLDASNLTMIESIENEDMKINPYTHIFAIGFGITIF